MGMLLEVNQGQTNFFKTTTETTPDHLQPKFRGKLRRKGRKLLQCRGKFRINIGEFPNK